MQSTAVRMNSPVPYDLPRPRKGQVIAVIPAYNEERFIASVVLQTRPFVEKVIVVDDGSADQTAKLARAVGAKVIQQTTNQGKAAALNRGFEEALNLGADIIVCLDADAQHAPTDIPSVIQSIVNGEADVVIGSRFLSVTSDIPKWRTMGQHALTSITNMLSGTKVTDSQSGFRAFSAEAVDKLDFRSTGLSVESEMQFLFEGSGVRVTEAPISVSYKDGNKRNPVVHGLEVIDTMLRLVARRRPLAFISLPGFVIGLLGVGLGVYVTYQLQNVGVLPVGYTILTAVLLLGGLLLSMFGIVLHSIGTLVSRIKEELVEAVTKAKF